MGFMPDANTYIVLGYHLFYYCYDVSYHWFWLCQCYYCGAIFLLDRKFLTGSIHLWYGSLTCIHF